MISPERSALTVISTIRDRLERMKIFKDTVARPLSSQEVLLASIFQTDTPVGRTSESITLENRVEGIKDKVANIRNWLTEHAPRYEEQPSARVWDEEGWAYEDGGFQISADNVTKPSNLSTKFLLSIFEVLPLDPPVNLWFSVIEDAGEQKYNLELSFLEEDGEPDKNIEYISNKKSFEKMPEEDAVIIEDLLTRVTDHLTEQK